MKRKEFGSNFHYPVTEQWLLPHGAPSTFSGEEYELFFSGRAALYHLLKQGIAEEGWKYCYLPSYYCHEVYRFVEKLPIELRYYAYNPAQNNELNWSEIPDRADTVFVNTSFFGIKVRRTTHLKHAIVIDDLTHCLSEIKRSMAHYCFGSLRKELPVGLGGFCFSPQGRVLPKAVSNLEADSVGAMKLEAMRLKASYVAGETVDKASFRELFEKAEHQLVLPFADCGMPELVKQQLFSLDTNAILEQKRLNLAQALEELSAVDGLTLLKVDDHHANFGLVFQFESSSERNAMKAYLIKNKVFPAVLWPEQKEALDQVLENTMLFVHVDFRYTANDISEITTIITRYFDHG